MSVMLHVANLHKVEVVTASISAQILLVVPTYKVLNAHFVNSGSRNQRSETKGAVNPW
jgi:hypothetical protein